MTPVTVRGQVSDDPEHGFSIGSYSTELVGKTIRCPIDGLPFTVVSVERDGECLRLTSPNGEWLRVPIDYRFELVTP
jgi:hypothetical protein